MHIGLIGIHLTTTFIYRQEHWFYTAGGLCHQRGCTRRCDCQTGNIPSAVLLHFLVQLRISFLDTKDERISLFTIRIINIEGTAFLSHLYRRAIGCQCKGTMNIHREVGCLLRTIAQHHGSNHITFCSNTHTRATPHGALLLDFLPKMIFSPFHFIALRITLHLLHDLVDLLQLQINDIIHQSLGKAHMLLEEFIIEISILGKWVHDIAIEVNAQ